MKLKPIFFNKIINPLIIFVLLFAFLSAGSKQELFSKIKGFYDKNTPTSFKANIKSLLIRNQLNRIPKDMVIFGKSPEVYFYFKKGHKPRIIIENVEDFYKNYFSVYEDMVSDSGVFFGIKDITTYKEFSKKYRMTVLKSSESKTEVKVKEKEALPGDFGVFTLNKKGAVIKSIYYADNKNRLKCNINYEKTKDKLLPEKVDITFRDDQNREKSLSIKFKKYNFVKVPDKIFDN